MQARSTGIELITRLEFLCRVLDWGIREPRDFADKVYDIHAEAVDAFVEPEANERMDGVADVRILPIQIGLLGGEEMEVVLVSLLVKFPCRACWGGMLDTDYSRG